MPHYWRHPAVPHIEIRNVEDGRAFAHGRHTHATFSIGAIMEGGCLYLNGHTTRAVSAGSVVLMNPGAVHACNPLQSQEWAYRMFYVDTPWLASVQQHIASGTPTGFFPVVENYSTDPALFNGLDSMYNALVANSATPASMQAATLGFFRTLLTTLRWGSEARSELDKVAQAAEFIREHCTQPLTLEAISAHVQLSASYLIRAFKARSGLTPHGYLIDCRLQLAREGLRRGEAIAEVAAQAGFADQAHLQRLFKRTLAATPGQYRG